MILPRLNYLSTSQSEYFDTVTFTTKFVESQFTVTVGHNFETVEIVTERPGGRLDYSDPVLERKSLKGEEVWDKWFYLILVLGGLWCLMSCLKLMQGNYLLTSRYVTLFVS